MRKKSLLALLLSTTMLVATACGGSDSAEVTENVENPDQVIIAVVSDIDSLDPAKMYEVYSTMVFSGVYETLYKFEDEASSAVPHLVESSVVSEDGLNVTMTLKEGITFASGNTMTSEDVAFSLLRTKYMLDNASSFGEHIVDVEIIDELTFNIVMDQADSSLGAKLSFGGMAILDSEIVISNGGDASVEAALVDTASEFLESTSAGSGPYILESHTPDVETILVKNELYWGEEPKLEKIIIKDIADPNTQMMMVKSGDVDVAFNLNSDMVKQLANDDSVEVLTSSTKTMAFLFMNMDEEIGGPVSNPLVQEAIRYAVDYEGLKYIVGEGSVTPTSFIQEGFLGAIGERDTDFRDTEKAIELLADAGYPDGFEISFPVTDLLPEGIALTDMAQKIQSDLAEVGIILNIEPLSWGGGYGDQYRMGEIGFSLMYWAPDYNDPTVQLKFLPGYTMGERVNWEVGSEPELEALYSEILAADNEDEKVELLVEVQEYTAEYGPYIPVIQFPTNVVINSSITGVVYTNTYCTDLANLDWK